MTAPQSPKAHPAAELFPLLDGTAFAELVGDIREHGLREPIVLHDGLILDGRNRHRACLEAGVTPTFREWDGLGDPIAYVVSLNLQRRHLNESQRAMVAANIANMQQGDNQHRQICRTSDVETASIEAVSQSQAAKLLNVSERSVRSAKKVQEEGVEELVEQVMEGLLSTSAAAEIAEQPPEKQRRIISVPKKERREQLRHIRQAKIGTKGETDDQRAETVLMAMETLVTPPVSAERMAVAMIRSQRAQALELIPGVRRFVSALEKEAKQHEKSRAKQTSRRSSRNGAGTLRP